MQGCWRKFTEGFVAMCTSFRDGCRSLLESFRGEAPADKVSESGAMSPRVTHLMDEYNSMLIKNNESERHLGGGSSWSGIGGGSTIYLYQERKITFMTHLLCCTLALALAILFLTFFHIHKLSQTELIIRIFVAVALRILADFLACWTLEWICTDIHRDRRIILWEYRQELSTVNGWIFRALVAVCPLFAVIAAIR